jgi:hypothetical protein
MWGSFVSCSVDFIGALRGALLNGKRPVESRLQDTILPHF